VSLHVRFSSMKIILFFVMSLFIVSNLFSWGWGGGGDDDSDDDSTVLVVDANPSSSLFGSDKSCEDTTDFYDTIQDAVDDAEDNTTIKICKGDYREKVTIGALDDINITSGANVDVPTDVNWTNNDIVLKMDGATNLHVENVSLHMDNTSEGARTIYLKSGGNFSATNLIVISDKGRAFYAKQDADNTLKKMTLHATEEAILIKSGEKQVFEDINISGGSDEGSGALYVKDAHGQDVNLTNVDINVSVRAVLIKNAIPNISKSKLVTTGTHTTIKFYDDTDHIKISDSCFYSKEDSDYSLYIVNTNANADVTDSCFYGKLDELAYSKADEYGFDKNYWEHLIAPSYDYHKVHDANPRSTCPNSCGTNTEATPVADYRMDECSWDGTDDEVKDQTDNHYDGTAKNGANTESNTTAGGGLCQVGKFDGDDDYVYNDDIYDYLKTTASLSFWIKTTQTGDKDDAWKSPGISGIEESGGDDDVFWGWLDDKGHIGISKGNSDGDDSRSDTAINDNQWHHIVLARDSDTGDIKIYVDGDLDKNGSTDSGDVGNSFTSIGRIENTDSGKNPKYFQGYIDEVKVYNKVLSSSDVDKIYNNEKDKKNYDGTDRVCNDCGGDTSAIEGDYNGVDYVVSDCNANDDWDDNLTTKLVSKEFSLTILARDKNTSDPIEANITKTEFQYYASGDNNACSGDMLSSYTVCENCGKTDSDGCLNIDNVQVDKSAKCVVVYIEGTETSTETDSNATSTDDFAVRPEKFAIDTPTDALYAGEDFNLSFSAKVYNSDANASDYNETLNDSFSVEANETKSGCTSGSFSVDNFSFADGKKEDVNSSYDEVGEINITIQEKAGSEYAEVDSDDTNDTTRFIEANTTTLHVSPYELNITQLDYNNSTGEDWLYMDANLSTNGVKLTLHVGAYNKQGDVLEDFNESCYAQDINVTFHYDTNITANDSSDINLTLDGNLTSSNVAFNDINKTLQIPKVLFVKGEANTSYSFGIDRNYTKALSPIDVALLEANITTQDVAKNRNGIVGEANQTSRFYYGRVYTQDIATSQKDDTSLVKILVYSEANNTNLDEELVHWYFYTPHDENRFGEVNESLVTNSIKKDTKAIDSNASYKEAGIYKVDINNSNEKRGTYFIHLDISPWLWYVQEGFGDDYNETNGTQCGEHPCIKYTYESPTTINSIQSGTFNGVNFDVNISKNSKGVRLLR